MPRRESTNYTAPTTKTLACYHTSRFNSLVAFNSDRKVKLNSDYTVSEDNAKSTLTLVKVGQRLNLFGIELETVGERVICAGEDLYVNLLDLIFDKSGFDPDFYRIESDCTVDAECVSQTFTKGWLRNNYKCFKAMYDLFSRFGITTNSTRVGMHVNVDLSNFGKDTATQYDNVRKLGYIINKHFDLMKIAFNRTGDTTYCGRMNTSKEYWKNTDMALFPSSHGYCYNVSHYRQNRVEIRLVGGQKDYPCFRNTMETAFFLIDRVKKLSWNDLDDVAKIFSGCNNYVFNRLSTNCYRSGVITSTDVEKIRGTVKEERFL